MERRVQHSRAWRAALGVLVLYGLVLQSLLGGVAATRMTLEASGVICAAQFGDPAENRDGQTDHETCCSIGCRLAQVALAFPKAETVPAFHASPARQQRWLSVRFHGPPTHPPGSTRPRAPPAVA